MKKRLVILSDYGLDDACATAFLLLHTAEFDGIDIVAIGGNTSSENSLRNAKKLLVAYANENNLNCISNVRLIDSCKISQPVCTLPSIHGIDGMGDLLTDVSPLPVQLLQFDEWLNGITAEQIILFSVGPCTITKLILQKIGACQLVIMAGVINDVPNYNGYEFNQGLDVEAFDFCVKYPHVIATLDSCRAPMFNLATAAYNGSDLLSKLIAKAITLAVARHKDNCYIYDYITAQYLITPEIFKVEILTDKWGNKLSNLVSE